VSSIGLFGLGPPGPHLRVPLSPASPLATSVRFVLTGLREPAFAAARQGVIRLAGGAALLLLIGWFAVINILREPTIIAGVVLAAFATTRIAALTVAESRQMVFETTWLAEQSAALRAASFEVVRCTVNGHVVDLTETGAGRNIAEWRDTDAGTDIKMVLDVTNGAGTVEQVQRWFRDLEFEFRPLQGSSAGPRVRFPQATYELRPSGMSTSWSLGALVVLTVDWPADSSVRRA
jgi:hypothetical protein